MANEIQNFYHKEFGELGVKCENDKFYFPATRCAIVLGYKNPDNPRDLKNGFDIEKIKELYKNKYQGPLVSYCEDSEEGFLSAGILSGKDSMIVSVYGNEDRILLVARYDNLGKGASGAAIQNMNILLGVEETLGLNIGE